MKTYLLIIGMFFPIALFSQDISLSLIADGFDAPLNIQHTNDNRLFVVEQGGKIKIIKNGTVNPTPFLDISNQLSTGGERGLLGLAFHPDYQKNGFFYLYYTNPDGSSQLSRFSVNENNPDIADPNSKLEMLSFSQPAPNHNGGCIAFGPDGMLYIGTGDGGGAGDQNNNAQNLGVLLGKLLRLDVDNPAPYIPSDNPYVDNENARDEIWAYGLRNPWKFSFDSETGTLWIADVGQNAVEEINHTPNSAGLNYGWRCYEGNDVYNNSENCPSENELTFPVAIYTHNNSGISKCSITGGYVYHGEYPNLTGKYLFADYCSNEIGVLDENNEITYFGPFDGNNFTSFGTDNQHNLYIAGSSSGAVYKIVDESFSTASKVLTNLTIYPNPASSYLNIENTGKLQQINLFSLQGTCLKIYHNPTEKISLSGIPHGIYFIQLIDNEKHSIIKKLIINP